MKELRYVTKTLVFLKLYNNLLFEGNTRNIYMYLAIIIAIKERLKLTLVGWAADCELLHKTHSGRTSPGCGDTPKSEAPHHSTSHEKIAHWPAWVIVQDYDV